LNHGSFRVPLGCSPGVVVEYSYPRSIPWTWISISIVAYHLKSTILRKNHPKHRCTSSCEFHLGVVMPSCGGHWHVSYVCCGALVTQMQIDLSILLKLNLQNL
jgi:hypothetical protein